jgi:hypothetical protein
MSPVTSTGGLAVSEELFDVISAQDVPGQAQLVDDGLFTLTQGQGGFAFELEYPERSTSQACREQGFNAASTFAR